MSFAATAVTGDAGSPRPRGGGYFEYAFEITQDPGDTGGTISSTPFTDPTNIEIVGWTPTNGISTPPTISSVSVNATTHMLDVVVEMEDGGDGRLRLLGR